MKSIFLPLHEAVKKLAEEFQAPLTEIGELTREAMLTGKTVTRRKAAYNSSPGEWEIMSADILSAMEIDYVKGTASELNRNPKVKLFTIVSCSDENDIEIEVLNYHDIVDVNFVLLKSFIFEKIINNNIIINGKYIYSEEKTLFSYKFINNNNIGKLSIEEWYQKRVDDWPPHQKHPDRNQDVEDARGAGYTLATQKIWEVRGRLAPRSWTKPGRPQKSG